MILHDLKEVLRLQPQQNLRLLLPDGGPIPDEFHITEVGHVTKRFVDCGGTVRVAEACVLQAWVANNDGDHRLSAGKLGSILEMAHPVVPNDSLEVEIEYEGCVISQYSILTSESTDAGLTLRLGHKHTDCLAKEACGLEACGCGANESASN